MKPPLLLLLDLDGTGQLSREIETRPRVKQLLNRTLMPVILETKELAFNVSIGLLEFSFANFTRLWIQFFESLEPNMCYYSYLILIVILGQ